MSGSELAKGGGPYPCRDRAASMQAGDPLGDMLAGQLSEHTRRAYRADLAHFLLYLRGEETGRVLQPGQWQELGPAERQALLEESWRDPKEALRLLVEADRASLVGYRAHLLESLGLSPATVNRRLSAARTVVRELCLRGLRPDNPADGMKGLRRNGNHSTTAGLGAADAKALLEAPQGDGLHVVRDRAILSLMVRNGLRVAEVRDLRVGDLGEDQGFRVATIRGKGRQPRQAKLAGPTWAALDMWLAAADRRAAENGAPLFVAVRKRGRGEEASWLLGNGPLSTQALAGIVSKWALAALPAEVANRVHPHALRHTFATIALEEGASLRRVQYAMGHADPRTTERYDRARENLSDNAADYVTRALNGGE